MKLNCDLGESFGQWKMGNDELIMPYIDMANIACGFHASDPSVMAKTVQSAKEYNVSIGAHPAYPDLQGFGRRAMSLSEDEIINIVVYQIGALQSICKAYGTQVDYVKPHGALYNTMMAEQDVREAVLKALAMLADSTSKALPLMVLANGEADQIREQASKYGVPLLFEAFADRAYTDQGSLVPRTQEGAVLGSDDAVHMHVLGLIKDQQVITASGKKMSIIADTICVHGDNAHALELVKSIRQLINSL